MDYQIGMFFGSVLLASILQLLFGVVGLKKRPLLRPIIAFSLQAGLPALTGRSGLVDTCIVLLANVIVGAVMWFVFNRTTASAEVAQKP